MTARPDAAEVAITATVVCAMTAVSLVLRDLPGPLAVVVAVAAASAGIAQLWWPLPGGIAAGVLAGVSSVATPASTISTLQIAWRERFGTAAVVAGVGAAGHLAQWFVASSPPIPFRWWALLVGAVYGALLAWGAFGQSRRALLVSLHQRAVRAEAEQGRRVAEARASERRELAREMHDVLAHRLTLVATHAGALEYRPDAPPERLAQAAGVVREGVHQALDELRQVIGLLREDGPADTAPPGLEDVPALLDDARRADQRVTVREDLSDTPPPVAVGRAAYRVVQEGLTNARRHAPGAAVELSLRGTPGEGLEIAVTNDLAETASRTPPPGGGLGLVGLTERVRLVGGRLDHGAAAGRFGLRAWLPWPP
ncbi:sensor histidine kinase [Promicromonospora citrea]|uniref:histidine kinase n=1 Tax=Promicromonospora citrea TaxID=43677 RepID=A0A8H9GH87_9MICO|nr:histidine kinase [Promicromonospora citrea]NNH51642.1 sensor histidine kinase [Promicromonospora citrea]GGM22615.1 hypothetical protein GCM10010102_17930 [Promicromonospora citrea]